MMELGVESSTFRSYTSPFDFSCSSESAAAAAMAFCTGDSALNSSSSSNGSSRLFELSPDTLSSIWSSSPTSTTSSESKEASATVDGVTGKTSTTSAKDSVNPASASAAAIVPSSAGDNEEKSMAFPCNTSSSSSTGTGRESSSPLSGSTGGTTSSSSVSSSLETSALELGSSLFGDSVWSSKGSFNDLGGFGSNDEEKRYLAAEAGHHKMGYLKPPGSNSSAAWGSFWSDLSPSLSPSNSETNLQHFGSPAPHNPFSTWNTAANTTNRRSAPPNSSPFSSGSVSPISRKQLSPSAASCLANGGCQSPHYRQQQQQQQQQAQGFPGNSYHRQYRRSASHPVNGSVQQQHQNYHNHQHHHNMPAMNTINDAAQAGGAFYPSQCGGADANFTSGWNTDALAINGYQQDFRNYNNHQQSSVSGMNGLDNMKSCFEPHLMDMVRLSGWDDSAKGRQQFFGSYASYDAGRGFSDILDPFDQMVPPCVSPLSSRMSPRIQSNGSDFNSGERQHTYSRKVFVGGLPPDIDEEEITASFRRFGPLIVDWPHKAESKSYFPPKGYAFLLFQDEISVHGLMDSSVQEGDKLYVYVSSPTNKDKPVQIRPWRLTDNECYLDTQSKLDPRLTVFVGGVPRPLRAQELAVLMNQRFGYVAYAGIDVDSELKYPKGAGRITFSNQQSYIAAINARFVQLQNGEIDKRVELKPYVLDDQICDYCHGMKCSGRSAPLFCSQVGCLAYLCEHCWAPYHSSPGKDHHKPVTKESSVDRSRPAAMRW